MAEDESADEAVTAKTESDYRGEVKAAIKDILQRVDKSLDGYIGAPPSRALEPSQEMWDHVHKMTKEWMSQISKATKSAVHRDKDGRVLTASDITEMFFRSHRTGIEEEIFSTVVPLHDINYIRVTLTLPEDGDGD